MATMKTKIELVEEIVEQSCQSVDMKTLLRSYSEGVYLYMIDEELEYLQEIATDMGIDIKED
jgi:hypothetical protein